MSNKANIPTEEVLDLSPFKALVMTIGTLPTAFTESMTYYEALAYFTQYLADTVIPTVNHNAAAVTELQELYVQLKNYVDNYFDNLDVQEEINNKLDAMAEAGTLQEVIAAYLNVNSYLAFNSVSDLKTAENIIDGSYVKTLGYRSAGDGGGNFYKIREIEESENPDEMTVIAITTNANLVAELIPAESISPEQLGAYCDLSHNDASCLSAAFTFAKNNSIPLYLNKNYYINTDITFNADQNHIDIIENSGFLKIDKSITMLNFEYSTIELTLKNGGANDVTKNSLEIKQCRCCSFKLTAKGVTQTAFHVDHQSGSNGLSRNDFKIYGENNMRTLLHKPTDTNYTGFFNGVYSTICDRTPVYPIHFEYSNDITIAHFENYFESADLSENSLEFVYCGSVHINKLAVGNMAKNAVFIQQSDVFIDEALVINGKDYLHQNRLGTGIKLKWNCKFTCNILRSVHCQYALDCTELTSSDNLVVNRIVIDDNDSNCKGIIFSSSESSGFYPLGYNRIHNPITGMYASSSYGDVINIRIFKQNNLIYVNGYMLVNAEIPAGSTIMSLLPSTGLGGCAPIERVEFPVSQGGSRALTCRLNANSTNMVSEATIDPDNGQMLGFNFVYRAKDYNTY